MPQTRILIVEDDAATVEALSSILEARGFQVSTAGNGREALEALHSLPRVSVVLLDLRLPVMNGEAFLREQSRDRAISAIPVVVISGEYAPELPRDVPLLRKPIDVDRLVSLILERGAAGETKTAPSQRGPIKRRPLKRSSGWSSRNIRVAESKGPPRLRVPGSGQRR